MTVCDMPVIRDVPIRPIIDASLLIIAVKHGITMPRPLS